MVDVPWDPITLPAESSPATTLRPPLSAARIGSSQTNSGVVAAWFLETSLTRVPGCAPDMLSDKMPPGPLAACQCGGEARCSLGREITVHVATVHESSWLVQTWSCQGLTCQICSVLFFSSQVWKRWCCFADEGLHLHSSLSKLPSWLLLLIEVV